MIFGDGNLGNIVNFGGCMAVGGYVEGNHTNGL